MMGLEKKLKTPKRAEAYEDEYCPRLPDELLFEEILTRLPVESLMRFKLVSKKWLHYISDSRFVHNHLRRQSQATKLSLIRALSHQSGGDRLFLWDGHSNKSQVVDMPMHMERLAGNFCRYHVIGTCNGLVCLCLRSAISSRMPLPLVVHQNQREVVLLWNPETGEGRDALVPPLPPSFYRALDPQFTTRSISDYHVFGFGFDEFRDDYKVVRIVPTQPEALLNIDVFSRNSGCWRKLDKALFGYTVFSRSFDSLLLNGCLYWLVMAVESKSLRILSFDLRDEEFRIIDALKHHRISDTASLFPHRLVKWKEDSLAYLSFPDDKLGQRKNFRVELVLDHNGSVVVDCQFVLSVQIFPWPRDTSLFRNDRTFCGVSHDQLFVVKSDLMRNTRTLKLLMYDLFGYDCENANLREASGAWCCSSVCQVHDYVPSLVSLYPNRKTMAEEKKKMEVRYWAEMYWKILGLAKQQFSLFMD